MTGPEIRRYPRAGGTVFSRLAAASLLVLLGSGCDSTTSPDIDWGRDGRSVEVRGLVLTPSGTPVPGVEVIGRGVDDREQIYPHPAVTNAEGQFEFRFREVDCLPAESHPEGEGVSWIWLRCPGCVETPGSCSGTTTRKVVVYTG